MILAIDPGTFESAYVLFDEKKKQVKDKGKIHNLDLAEKMITLSRDYVIDECVIEQIKSYGMPLGDSTIMTCEWIGRFDVYWVGIKGRWPKRLIRKTIVSEICGSGKATDSNVRQALVDEYAPGQSNHGKGTKKEPGFFYGFSADVWQAFAVAHVAATKPDLMIDRDMGEKTVYQSVPVTPESPSLEEADESY